VALVFIFFSCGEDFPRSSLCPGWLELPIADYGWTLEGVATPLFQWSIGNQQWELGLWVTAKGRAVSPVE
jgi:hypothetical protein